MRFTSFHLPVMLYLLTEGYLNYLNTEEFETIMENLKSSNISQKETLFWAIRSFVYLEKGEDDKANEAYNNVITFKFDSKYEEVWGSIGYAYYKKGEHNKAISLFKKILEIDPYYYDAWNDLLMCYEEMGKLDKAIEECKHALENYPKFEYLWFLLGRIYININQFDQAIDIYNQALKINVNFEQIWEGLANIYDIKGETEKKIEAYSHALAINPEHYILWFNLGVSYIDIKKFNRAIDALKRSLEIDKTFEDAWEVLGYAYGQIEEHEKEIQAYLKALEYDPELENTWYNLGLAYYNKDEYDKAIDAFSHVLHINPDNKDAQEHLHLLKEEREISPEIKTLELEKISTSRSGYISIFEKFMRDHEIIEDNFNNKLIDNARNAIDYFEGKIRKFIEEQLKEYYKEEWWESGIPSEFKEKIEKDLKNRKKIHPKREYKKIQLLNFKNYEDIICRKKNWNNIFKDYFDQEYNVHYLFNNLRYIRNDLFHGSFFEEDFLKLIIFIDNSLKFIENN